MILDHLSFKFVNKCQQGVILDHLGCDTGSPNWKLALGEVKQLRDVTGIERSIKVEGLQSKV